MSRRKRHPGRADAANTVDAAAAVGAATPQRRPKGPIKPPESGLRPHEGRGYLWWFLVNLLVLVVLPDMYAGTFTPKLFWVLLTLALASVFIWPLRPTRFALTPLGLIWIAYLSWALLSLTWAPQPYVAFARWAILVVWTCAYFLALRTRFWENDKFWTLFHVLFVFVCLIGCVQFCVSDLPWLDWIPASGLPASTMGHRNYACFYLAVTLPFVVWWLYRTTGRRRVLAVVALAIGLTFLVFTRAREAWIAWGASVVFMFFSGGGRKIRAHARVTKRLAYGALVLLVAVSVIGPTQNVLRHGWRKMPAEKKSILTTLIDPLKRKTDPRLGMWIPALKMLKPSGHSLVLLHGFGFGNFPIASSPYVGEIRTLDYEIHNDYLQALVDLGLPGMILFITVFLWLLRLAWKGRTNGLIIAAGGATVGFASVQFFMFTSENLSPVVWMIGAAAILNGQGADRPLFELRTPAWFPRIAHALAAIFLAAFCLVVGVDISAERQVFYEMDTGVRVGRLPDFDRLARTILPRMRFNANIAFINSHRSAPLAFQARNLDAAALLARRALYLHPSDWGSMAMLADVALASGRLDEAIRYLEKAADLSSRSQSPDMWVKLRNYYARAGRMEQAQAVDKIIAEKQVAKPSRCSPPDGAEDIPVALSFRWDPSPNAEKYDLYLWKDGDPFPKFPQVYHIKTNKIDLGMRGRYGTDYRWMVKAFGPTGNSTGDICRFRTVVEAKDAKHEPSR